NVDNGWFREFYEAEFRTQVEGEDLKVSLDVAPGHTESDGHVHLSKKRWLELILTANSCNCTNCTKEREENFAKWVSLNAAQDFEPLVERIDKDKLDAYLQQEF